MSWCQGQQRLSGLRQVATEPGVCLCCHPSWGCALHSLAWRLGGRACAQPTSCLLWKCCFAKEMELQWVINPCLAKRARAELCWSPR